MERNVEVARRAGWQARRFVSDQRLRIELLELGLVGPVIS